MALKLRKGLVVYVYNTTLGGRIFFEGEAVITSVLDEGRAKVRFIGKEDRSSYERWIDPQGQQIGGAHEYVERLNKRCA
jgi:predicted glycosyl hydrolase (DUF1957 family)